MLKEKATAGNYLAWAGGAGVRGIKTAPAGTAIASRGEIETT